MKFWAARPKAEVLHVCKHSAVVIIFVVVFADRPPPPPLESMDSRGPDAETAKCSALVLLCILDE